MRFWLTLILGTVTVSAGLTALTMYRGAQTVTQAPPPPPEDSKPELGFVLEKGQRQIANGVESRLHGAVKVGSRHSVTVKGKNQGAGTLTLKLIRGFPEESMEVRFNGQLMTKDTAFTLKPGETGEFVLQWSVTEKQFKEQKPEGYNFRAEIDWNDHRFDEPLLIEVLAKVEP